MPFQYPYPQGQQGHVPYQPRQVPYYYEDLQHSSPTPSWPAYQRPTNSVVETKYLMKKNGPMGTSGQASAAASFFAKAHQRLQMNNEKKCIQNSETTEQSEEQFPTNFKAIVHRSPPQIPNHILRKLEVQESVGKIRVILRVAKGHQLQMNQDLLSNQMFHLDRKRKQLTLYDPSICRGQESIEERKVGVAAPKMFAFDNVFTDEDPQEDVAASALSDIIASVVNGSDGCLFCFGHANLGKSTSMIGSDENSKSIGMIPIAISWLYRAIKEKKSKSGARFSIRVSALEITSQREHLRDLLEPYSSETDQSPGVYLRNLPINKMSPSQGSNLDQLNSELRASTPEKAAYYFDAALAARSADTRGRESHLLFTLHVYQYSVMGGATSGGRSRLHLIDFGGCERTKTPGGVGITLSGLGNVILGIFNGQKHLPHRESKVTQLLRECLGSLSCQATMLAHVSPEPSHYSETLHTVQLASRLHRMRMRRKRLKSSRSRSSNGSRSGSGSSSGLTTSGTSTNASSSEFSDVTVVYRGQSDSGTDSEHPPLMPLSTSGSSSLLRTSRNGSLDEIPRPASGNGHRRKKILTNGAISPRQCLSPQPYLPRSPATRSSSSLSGSYLPAIPEVANSHRMPLSGLVPVNSRLRMQMQQQQQQQQQHQQSQRQPEIWIDGPKFLDQQKANMINNWVETQSTSQDSNQVFMTQFKQASDNEHLQHQQSKPKPPPPPPRRTPPRESNPDLRLSQDPIMQSSFKPNQGLNQLQDSPVLQSSPRVVNFVQDPVNQLQSQDELSVSGQAHHVHLREAPEVDIMNNPMNHQNDLDNHPLRILSEENLTIVSSFAGSTHDLNQSDDDKVDVSKLSFFQVPDFSSSQMTNENILQTFKDFEQLQNQKNDLEMNEKMTPQKNFQLLSEHLRHPDGSSNPELNHVVEQKMDEKAERSPGNGRSSSDQENDNSIEASVKNSENNNPTSSELDMSKKSSKFGFKFFKLFKRNRPKSTERTTVPIPTLETKEELKKEDPAMLSAISTEWEFEPQDETNGNTTPFFEHIWKKPKDRKSSGYDSLGGDESSSLDSNETTAAATKQPLQTQPIKLSKEMNNTLAKAFFSRPASIHPEYAKPTDFYGMNIRQYDELDIIRMEQRNKK